MNVANYRQYSDIELVSLCLKGDSQAWEAVINRYRRLIYSIPVRFGFASDDAADVFQSVCLKLIEHLHELKDETKVSAWLITTTTRQCMSMRAHRFREGASEEEVEDAADPAENVESLRVHVEERHAVRESVGRLPERCRQLLQLLYFDPKSPTYEEVGELMAMPVPSIGPTRARCLDKLRTLLRRRGIK